ncbi:MAG: sugar ABC transporter substrate-binding protein [Oscillospiraceae bacterium]|nr:sugar ABC transporter substrate-binding protein [Oscillospiraceae bacterium]
MACSTGSPVDNSGSGTRAASDGDKPAAETPKDDGGVAPAAEPYKIGFSLQTVEVPVFQRMSNGMENACQDHGAAYQCMVSNSDAAKHIANILDLLRK